VIDPSAVAGIANFGRAGATFAAPWLIDPFVSTTRHLVSRIVAQVMALADLLVASTPIILVVFCLACRGVPTLIAWRRERKYQAEWHRTFGTSSRSSSCAADSDTARAGP
jgi:nitrate/nitrite transporter NarK